MVECELLELPPQPARRGASRGMPARSVVAAALQVLQSSGHGPLQRIHCEQHAGILVLTGSVPSYYLKQLAQERVRDLEGVAAVRNLLTIGNPRGF